MFFPNKTSCDEYISVPGWSHRRRVRIAGARLSLRQIVGAWPAIVRPSSDPNFTPVFDGGKVRLSGNRRVLTLFNALHPIRA